MTNVEQISVATWSKAWVCSHSFAGIVVSSPGGGMDVCLLWMMCVVRDRSLFRADDSSRGVLPSVVCQNECGCEASKMGKLWPTRGCCAMEKNKHRHARKLTHRSTSCSDRCQSPVSISCSKYLLASPILAFVNTNTNLKSLTLFVKWARKTE